MTLVQGRSRTGGKGRPAACRCSASHSTTSAPSSSLPVADLQADVTIHGQGLTVTWNMPASDAAGTQITGAALSNTTNGPDMYVLEMATPSAAATLAAQMQNSAGPYTDANGNSVGSVSITVGGSEIIVSTDSTPAMTDFVNQLKANS